jgi:ankyrin repeat protein
MAGFGQLSAAVENNNLNLVQRLIHQGTHVNSRDSQGWTALHYAALHGYSGIAADLIRLKAEINAKDIFGNTPLHILCSSLASDPIINEVMIKIPWIWRIKSLSERLSEWRKMTEKVKIKMVDCLLKHGANINSTSEYNVTSVHRAVKFGNVHALKVLATLGVDIKAVKLSGLTPLANSAEIEEVGLVEHLVKKGAKLNISMCAEQALHIAVKQKRRDIVDILVHHGADVNITREIEPIFLMALKPDVVFHNSELHNLVLDCLVQLGVEVDAPRCLVPLLHDALEFGDLDMIKCLVQYGAHTVESGKVYLSALVIAVCRKDHNMIDLLIRFGANINAKYEYNITLMHEAVQRNQTEEIILLSELHVSLKHLPKMTGGTAFLEALKLADEETFGPLGSRCQSTVLC